MKTFDGKSSGQEFVRDLKLPPDGFRVRTASERELQVYGLPRRPDENRFPQQAMLWDKVSRRSLRFVRPKLVPFPDRASSQLRDFKKPDLAGDLLIRDVLKERLRETGIRICWVVPYTSGAWSGAIVNRPGSEPLMTVTGQWVVPRAWPPASAWNGINLNDGTYLVGAWVGLDGANGTGDVLQAGTASSVVVSGGKMTSSSYYAWTEWFGAASILESDFPVNPGDAILCTVCAPFGSAHGTAMFVNQTTGLAANYGINPPAGVTLSGNVAEWIVEDPTTAANTLYPFPNYGVTNFTNCTAGTQDIGLNLRDACPVNLVDGSGTVISEATITGNTTLTCEFLG